MELRRVLVPVDLSPASAHGLAVAGAIARRHGGALHVVHVEPGSVAMVQALAGAGAAVDLSHLGEEQIEMLRKRVVAFVAEHAGGATVETIDVLDDVFVPEAITRAAEERRADLICMNLLGRSAETLRAGGTASSVVRHATVPVLVFRRRADEDGPPPLAAGVRGVLAAVDLGPGSREVARAAAALVPQEGRLHLAHVIEMPRDLGFYGESITIPAEDVDAAREWAEGALAQIAPERAPVSLHVAVGHAAEALLELERELAPDLVVVGTHGRHGMDRFTLGSVAERVVRHAANPVLVFPTRGAR